MMSAYDAVYSYIYAENGHYFLIKPFTPFTGYVGEDFSTDYYYDISTAMMPAQYYYCIDESGNSAPIKVRRLSSTRILEDIILFLILEPM